MSSHGNSVTANWLLLLYLWRKTKCLNLPHCIGRVCFLQILWRVQLKMIFIVLIDLNIFYCIYIIYINLLWWLIYRYFIVFNIYRFIVLIDLNYFIVFNIYRFIVLIHTVNQRTALHVGYRVIPIHSGDSYFYISPPLHTAWISVPNIEHCTDNCTNTKNDCLWGSLQLQKCPFVFQIIQSWLSQI